MQPAHIRRAGPGDHDAFTRLFPELGVDDPVPDRARWARDLQPSTWIAEQGGAVLGYCFAETLGDSGYVRHLVVAPPARGLGLGRSLLDAVTAHLRERGARRCRLNVKEDNRAALRLYEALGFRTLYRSAAFRLPRALADALPGEAQTGRVEALAPEDDAGSEAAYDLPAGLLAAARRAGRECLVLRSSAAAPADTADAAPLGLAVFDPTFPRAFPFRVARPTLAGAFLRALRPRDPDPTRPVIVVVENDLRLAELLLAAGAELRHEILHLGREL